MAYKSLWIAGFALMALCAVVYGWSLHARDVGIQALENARDRLSAAPTHRDIETSPAVAPDTASWSSQRVAAYQEALAQDATPFALLHAPSLDLVVPVYDGTSEWALNRGAGRIQGTATSTSSGNLGIAGHRDGFFRALRKIQVGDPLILEGTSASTRYRVTQLHIVEPTDIGVLRATPMPTLTLVTCYPFYYIGPAPRRFIVHAARIDDSETTHQTPDVEQRGQAHEQHAGGTDQR